MRIIQLVLIITLVGTGYSFAAGTRYELRVDGLACPFCAYGIEKTFIQTEGGESVEIDIKNGLVIVNTAEGIKFSEDKLIIIIGANDLPMKSKNSKLQ